MLDLSLDEDLETRFWSVLANNDPEAIAWLLPQDNVLLGLADSGAHVSQLCDACFATDLLGNWVRDKRGHAARARDPQAHRRAGRRVRARRPRHVGSAREAADLAVFDRGARSRPVRCAASATSRRRRTASPPTPRSG